MVALFSSEVVKNPPISHMMTFAFRTTVLRGLYACEENCCKASFSLDSM